ncbi:MAG: hypothetical protein ACO1SV_20960 [Fimbriimonas sp.]
MCNSVFISTDSPEDLAAIASDQFIFESGQEGDREDCKGTLRYPHIWFLSSRYGGCSCHYRHLCPESRDMGFEGRVDWYGEDEDDMIATQAVYDVLSRLVQEGYRVDAVDFWEDASRDDVRTFPVSVSEVSREAFRFWEGCRFEFIP